MCIYKTILIDLDGVLNNYDGNYNEKLIPPIKDGAKDFLARLSLKYKIVIFTSRNIELTKLWLKSNCIDIFVDNITNTKIPAFLIIDDRCLTFDNNYEELLTKVDKFIPYWKSL